MDTGNPAHTDACEAVADEADRLHQELDDIERRLNLIERTLRIAFGRTLPGLAATDRLLIISVAKDDGKYWA